MDFTEWQPRQNSTSTSSAMIAQSSTVAARPLWVFSDQNVAFARAERHQQRPCNSAHSTRNTRSTSRPGPQRPRRCIRSAPGTPLPTRAGGRLEPDFLSAAPRRTPRARVPMSHTRARSISSNGHRLQPSINAALSTERACDIFSYLYFLLSASLLSLSFTPSNA